MQALCPLIRSGFTTSEPDQEEECAENSGALNGRVMLHGLDLELPSVSYVLSGEEFGAGRIRFQGLAS